jgi:hypothetical protein
MTLLGLLGGSAIGALGIIRLKGIGLWIFLQVPCSRAHRGFLGAARASLVITIILYIVLALVSLFG